MTHHHTHLLASLAFLGLAGASFGAALLGGNDYDLSWHTIDGGGGYSAGGDFELEGTIGQHDAGPVMTGGDFALAGGFWAAPGDDPGAEVATLFDFQIITGSLISGDLTDLEQSDDSYLHTRSGFGNTFIDLHNMHLGVNAVTSMNSPTTIDVTVENRIDEPSGLAKLSLRNWNTGEFDTIAQFPLGSTDDSRVFAGLDGNDYVSGVGEIEVRMQHLVFVPIFAYIFESFVDQVEIRVHQ